MSTQDQDIPSFPTSSDLGFHDLEDWENQVRRIIEHAFSDVPHEVEKLHKEILFDNTWEEVSFRVRVSFSDLDYERAVVEIYGGVSPWRIQKSREDLDYEAFYKMLLDRLSGLEDNLVLDTVTSVSFDYTSSHKVRNIEVEGHVSSCRALPEKKREPLSPYVIAARLGLEDFSVFEERERTRNSREGRPIERRTGRTTRMLCSALAASDRGNTIDIIAATESRRKIILDLLYQMAHDAGIDRPKVVKTKRGEGPDIEFHDPV